LGLLVDHHLVEEGGSYFSGVIEGGYFAVGFADDIVGEAAWGVGEEGRGRERGREGGERREGGRESTYPMRESSAFLCSVTGKVFPMTTKEINMAGFF
jgi:hypothetical protein